MKDGNINLPSLNNSPSPSAVAGATKTPAPAGKTATPAPTQSMSYSQLVQAYGSNRIQFDATCQAVPKSMALKSGTSILLDNRSNQSRTITMNGKTYSLVPYGYQVVTVSSSTLPQTVGVNCNNQINAGTINLQANISGE